MVWLPNGEKISKIYLFVVAQLTNVTDRQTDTHTPHDNIGRAYASHCAAKMLHKSKQEVKVILQKVPHRGPIPPLGVTPGGRNLYH